MTIWPIVIRELRAESRRPANYWLRVFGAGTATLVAFLFILNPVIRLAQVGQAVFTCLNALMFAAIWLLAPVITADCLSRERREGTLGLLFLTPLKPFGIVVGKSLIHGWRAATLFLAVVPVLALPLLFGGVGWRDVAMAFLLDLSALLWALAAGLLVSAWGWEWRRVVIAAEVLGLMFAFIFMAAHYGAYLALDAQFGINAKPGASGTRHALLALAYFWGEQPFVANLAMVFGFNTGCDTGYGWSLGRWSSWDLIWSSQPLAQQHAWFAFAAGLMVFSVGLLGLTTALAAWRVARSWRQVSAPARRGRLWQTFCTPRFWRSVFRDKLQRLLERNPVGWLQQWTWSARLTRWVWCLFLVEAECALIGKAGTDFLWSGQSWLAQLLLLNLALAAAASFHQEKESGMLELLLVAPLTAGQIAWGRLCGLWRQFAPAALILSVAWLLLMWDEPWFIYTGIIPWSKWWSNHALPAIEQAHLYVLFAAAYVALPVVGLYFSLIGRRPLITAAALTVLVGAAARWLAPTDSWLTYSLLLSLAAAITLALAFYWLVCRALRRRQFILHSGGSVAAL